MISHEQKAELLAILKKRLHLYHPENTLEYAFRRWKEDPTPVETLDWVVFPEAEGQGLLYPSARGSKRGLYPISVYFASSGNSLDELYAIFPARILIQNGFDQLHLIRYAWKDPDFREEAKSMILEFIQFGYDAFFREKEGLPARLTFADAPRAYYDFREKKWRNWAEAGMDPDRLALFAAQHEWGGSSRQLGHYLRSLNNLIRSSVAEVQRLKFIFDLKGKGGLRVVPGDLAGIVEEEEVFPELAERISIHDFAVIWGRTEFPLQKMDGDEVVDAIRLGLPDWITKIATQHRVDWAVVWEIVVQGRDETYDRLGKKWGPADRVIKDFFQPGNVPHPLAGFAEATGETLNGNSLMVCLRLPEAPDHLPEVLSKFLQTEILVGFMREAYENNAYYFETDFVPQGKAAGEKLPDLQPMNPLETREHLKSLLTCEQGPFLRPMSAYGTTMLPPHAAALVQELISAIAPDPVQEWKAWFVPTDFSMINFHDVTGADYPYFEFFGGDSCTVFQVGKLVYILLTNGSD